MKFTTQLALSQILVEVSGDSDHCRPQPANTKWP